MNTITDTNHPDFIFICCKCKIPKTNSEYYDKTTGRIKRRKMSICKVCANEKASEWGKKNKEKRREISKRYLINNPEASNRNYKQYRKKSPIMYSLGGLKGNAKRRGLSFNINKKDIEELLIKQNYKCYYTDKPLNMVLGFKDSFSVDRINSDLGYEKNNICICQRRINIIKNDMSIEELLDFCKNVILKFKQ